MSSGHCRATAGAGNTQQLKLQAVATATSRRGVRCKASPLPGAASRTARTRRIAHCSPQAAGAIRQAGSTNSTTRQPQASTARMRRRGWSPRAAAGASGGTIACRRRPRESVTTLRQRRRTGAAAAPSGTMSWRSTSRTRALRMAGAPSTPPACPSGTGSRWRPCWRIGTPPPKACARKRCRAATSASARSPRSAAARTRRSATVAAGSAAPDRMRGSLAPGRGAGISVSRHLHRRPRSQWRAPPRRARRSCRTRAASRRAPSCPPPPGPSHSLFSPHCSSST
mmetsp:Transcript_78323/g.221480  ORF Transcript_78323/g.221480 Transcript_78323/m.221480 type:complete len:283 (+) Transcript_78323:708-1556(+)